MPKAKAAAKPKIPKKGILLPRGYLSWSQLDKWESDREEYKRIYFFGGQSFQNDAMKFGSHIADVLEGKKKPENHTEQSVKLLCQKYDSQEHEIRVKIKTNYGPVELFGKIDSFSTQHFGFIENKTGTTKWSNKKAANHGQLSFYYVMIAEAKGVRPRLITLQHLDTIKDPHGKHGRALSGYIYPYEVELGMGDEIEMRRRIENAVREIDIEYRAFISNKK